MIANPAVISPIWLAVKLNFVKYSANIVSIPAIAVDINNAINVSFTDFVGFLCCLNSGSISFVCFVRA